MKRAVHFDTEAEFRTWFEQNLAEFGINKIIVNQEVCPDYVVIMKTGETKRIEAELLAINFKYHRHEAEKVDLIVACYANADQIGGVPVMAVNKLWEYRPENPESAQPPNGPLSEDELKMLEAVQFSGGIELSALAEGDFRGNSRIFLHFNPDQVTKFPRATNSLLGVVSPKTKQFIKKYHYAIIGENLSERACAAFDGLSRRGLIKARPLSFMLAAYDGVISAHPGWIPTEVVTVDRFAEKSPFGNPQSAYPSRMPTKRRNALGSSVRAKIFEFADRQKAAGELQRIVESLVTRDEATLRVMSEREFDDLDRVLAGITEAVRRDHFAKGRKWKHREARKREGDLLERLCQEHDLKGGWRDHVSVLEIDGTPMILSEPYGLDADDFEDFFKMKKLGWKVWVDERLATYFPGRAVCVLLCPPN
ncbi:MAG TPA: hypothetical protein VMF08_02780 [Candidatus Sulfotelmatobacter sp.]|nr:hypothetical protein [Candidatus Sulfotelmatobacter sp.]